MSRGGKGSGGSDSYYHEFLFGESGQFNFKTNPNVNREIIIERMYTRILTELATNRFKWSGLPKSVNLRYLEMQLFYRALAVFFYDTGTERFLALAGSPAGHINMMQEPTAFQVYGSNYVGKTIGARNCVPIWANYLRMPDTDIIRIFAERMANIDRTIEINLKNARRSKVAFVTENTALSVDNIVKQIDEGTPYIKASRSMENVITAVDLGVEPHTIEKLSIIRARTWGECMTLLGIDNANQDKKERLVASEVDANDDQVNSTRWVNLNSRRTAAEQINDKYPGLNVTVDYNADIQTELPAIGDYDSLGEMKQLRELDA